jgi:pimeloyl-ACP methyl ester carboxylesterase
MPSVDANGIRIEYESHGNAADPAILLIMGLGMQLVDWPIELVDGLVEAGFRVIRFDNRDAGLSTQFDGFVSAPLMFDFTRWSFGWPIASAYRLDDMAADAVALLDSLGIERAHVVGISMGGMIAQLMAIRHRERVASLTSIMSSSSARVLPQPRLDALLAVGRLPEANASPDKLLDHYEALFRTIGSPKFPTPPARMRQTLRKNLARAHRPNGTQRQIVAILASGDRSMKLPQIVAPTLVIHGDSDPLVPPGHGQDTAAKIPGAELQIIEGMGHDLPPTLVPRIAKMIALHCAAARA